MRGLVNATLEHALPVLPPNEIVGCSIRELSETISLSSF